MRIYAALVAVALAVMAPAAANAQMILQPSVLPPGQLVLQGRGEVTASPDTALVTSGVTSQGATAREALDANTRDMAALIETLKAAGIEARDIQTSGFSVSPNYVYTDARDQNGYTLPPKINGYIVSNMVTVRVRDLAILGRVLDQAVTVGANTINGVSFSVAEPSALYDQARKLAVEDAREKAELYAAAAGVELGHIVVINETPSYSPPQPYMMRAEAADMSAASVPVETGELSFAIDVSVSWYLVQ
jgi:uncharacterized protein YggE